MAKAKPYTEEQAKAEMRAVAKDVMQAYGRLAHVAGNLERLPGYKAYRAKGNDDEDTLAWILYAAAYDYARQLSEIGVGLKSEAAETHASVAETVRAKKAERAQRAREREEEEARDTLQRLAEKVRALGLELERLTVKAEDEPTTNA